MDLPKIKVDIWLTRDINYRPIGLSRGSEVPIELTVKDIPSLTGAAVEAYAAPHNGGRAYINDPPPMIAGNTITIMPHPGLFALGWNDLQVEIVVPDGQDGTRLIPFTIPVHCRKRVSDAGDPATPEEVKPLVERAEAAAAESEASANKAQQIKDSIPEDYSELAGDVSRLSESIIEISEYVDSNKLFTAWEHGGIYDATGLNNDSASNLPIRMRTVGFITADKPIHVNIESGYGIGIYRYNANKEFVSQQKYTATADLNLSSATYIRLAVYKTDNSDIDNLDAYNITYSNIIPILDRIARCEEDIKNLTPEERPKGEKDVTTTFTLTSAKGIRFSDGTEVSSSAMTNYSVTDYIEVYDGSVVTYTSLVPNTLAIIAQYDANKNFVRAVEGTGSTINGSFNCSKGYIRMTFRTDRIVPRTVYATLDYGSCGLKIGMLGDSVTWGRIGGASGIQQTEKGIPYWVGEITGNTVDNLGVGSMGWISHQYLTTNAMEYVRTLDFSKYDFVTLAWGLNDGDIALGTYTDTDGTTIMGAVFDVCNYIMTQNPKIQLILIAPTVGKGSSFPYYNPNGQHTASDHWRFTGYFEQIKLFADKYSIPLIYGNYCLNAWNRNLYIGDNVHPTEEGYKVVGRYIASQMSKIIG